MSASAPDRGDGDGPDVYDSYSSDHDGPKPTAPESEGMTRRGLFRRAAVAGGTIVTVGAGSSAVPRYSPVGRAAAIAPAIPIGIAAGAAGIAYLSGTEYWPGDDRDYSGYTGADALHQEIAVGGREMQNADERVMTSIENNIQYSENVALAKGKVAIIEEMNSGSGETAANDAMQAAIDDYYTSIQKNIITHWNQQLAQIAHHFQQLSAHSDISVGDVYGGYNNTTLGREFDPDNPPATPETDGPIRSTNLLNGESVDTYQWGGQNETSSDKYHQFVQDPNKDMSNIDEFGYQITDPDGESFAHFVFGRYQDAWNDLLAARDSVNADLSGFVSDVYAQYSPGDIPTEDLVDPLTASTELRQNYQNRAGQSAHAAMLGIPTEAELTADLEIVSDEAEDGIWEVEADLFTSHVPTADVSGSASISSGVLTLEHEPVSDSTYELTTTDSETVEFNSSELSDNGDGTWEVDLSGDLSTTSTSVDTLLEEEGFTSGTTYQPSNWSEPFYIAYNYIDEATGEERGDFTQIESETTIVEVTDSNGETVENFRTESQNNQTADVSALEEELAQIREEQIRLQEEAEEKTSDGGSGGDWFPEDSQAGPLVGAFLFVLGILGVGKILDS